VRFVKLAALLLVGSSAANADVITFDNYPGEETLRSEVISGGFVFVSDHMHAYGDLRYPGISYNGTTTLGYESGRGSPITMSALDGTLFSLLSLDAAEFYAPNNPDRPNADFLEIHGFHADGHESVWSLALDGVVDGPGGLVDFQHFVLPSFFVDLLQVTFIGVQGNGAAGGVNLDNIEIFQSSSVPEPGTLGLMGLALAGVAAFRRRRNGAV
jgi:hypothetical protein